MNDKAVDQISNSLLMLNSDSIKSKEELEEFFNSLRKKNNKRDILEN